MRFAVILCLCAVCLWAVPLLGQSNSGELRLKVTDPAGLGVKATVKIASKANQYRNSLVTSDQGSLDVQRLPYGMYELEIQQPGFATSLGPSIFILRFLRNTRSNSNCRR